MSFYKVSKISRRSGNYRRDWQETAKEDKVILGMRCEVCGSTKDLERHHIVHKRRGGQDLLLNLQVLCKSCHHFRHTRDKPKR